MIYEGRGWNGGTVKAKRMSFNTQHRGGAGQTPIQRNKTKHTYTHGYTHMLGQDAWYDIQFIVHQVKQKET